MPRHSYVRVTKLTSVQGRIDYISNPERQEYLYATYDTADPEFWEHLSEQSQYDFWRSNQKKGSCIEGRELVIALPESLQQENPNELLELFTEQFRQKYGMQCSSALHHNKSKTNYHIHLIFSEREVLEKTEVKYASRNMFYNEEGRHVRTKKEILNEQGNIRPGCHVIAKGEIYEIKWFGPREDRFKEKAFVNEVKEMYTGLINGMVKEDAERLKVFDPSGPYLPTKKIGKNNPKEKEIRADNALRKEWNQTVDQVLIAGGTHEEVTAFKKEEVTEKIAESVKSRGEDPKLFATLLRFAIEVLKEFLHLLMSKDAVVQEESVESAVKPVEISDSAMRKEPRPDSRKEELAFRKIEPIHRELSRCNRKIYALQKQKAVLEKALEVTPKDIFHRKERKELEKRIIGLQNQIDSTRKEMECIPQMHGYDSVKSAETVYKHAKAALDDIRRKQAQWDGVEVSNPNPVTQQEKISVLKELAAKRLEQERKQRDVSVRKETKNNRRDER